MDPYGIAGRGIDSCAFTRLRRVDRAERISAKRQGNLEHPRAQPVQGSRNVRLPAFRHDGQRREANRTDALGEPFAVLQRSPDQRQMIFAHPFVQTYR